MPAYNDALKKCSEHCAFGTFLEEALRGRFFCGLRNKSTQKKLRADKNLTWISAVEIALAMEITDRQANNFRNAPSESEINYVKPPLASREWKERIKPCFRCGDNHMPQNCRFKNLNCWYCKAKGHIARVCRKNWHPLHKPILSRIKENTKYNTWRTVTCRKIKRKS